ncbi:MAG: hypothetical protein ABFS18_11120 [Thermodesulfobacteriota bacterium]
MGLLKTLFGVGKEKKNTRILASPKDLGVGDIIKFSFLPQADLSGKEFEVTQLNSYVYDGASYPELILKDRSNNIVFLTVEDEDGEEYLAVSKKVSRGQFSKVIVQDEFDTVLKKGAGRTVTIVQPKLAGLESWLADSYTATSHNVQGAYVKGDARTLASGEFAGKEGFTSCTLLDGSEEYALEIEVYSTNEIELSVTVYHDFAAIDEMWPSTIE